MGAWCAADKVHSYARIYNPDDGEASEVFYIADKRSRRSYSPQVVVFAVCAVLPGHGGHDAEVACLGLGSVRARALRRYE